MRFGIFYEHQLPKPWNEGDEARLFHEALEQVVLADRLGFDYAWEVEHHFLEEYSHSSAPEVFLAACAALTKTIRVGHGIRQVIPNYNHPARTAEGLATLDIISNGRLDFGIGEGATRLELGGFDIPAKEKRAMALEAARADRQHDGDGALPRLRGQGLLLPLPQRRAQAGAEAAPADVDGLHQPRHHQGRRAERRRRAGLLLRRSGGGAAWAEIYYGIIKSEECVPLGHAVNANIAMVSNFSVHRDRAEAIRRGQEGFEFFSYRGQRAGGARRRARPLQLWARDFQPRGARSDEEIIAATRRAARNANGIGTPDDIRDAHRRLPDAGVDQVIFLQQAGRNRHEHICESLELFAAEVMPEFKAEVAEREAKKGRRARALHRGRVMRKQWMKPLADDEIPVIKASVDRAQFARGTPPAGSQAAARKSPRSRPDNGSNLITQRLPPDP